MSALTSTAPSSPGSARAPAPSQTTGEAKETGVVFGPKLPVRYLLNKLITCKVMDPTGNTAFVFSLVHDTADEKHGWKTMDYTCAIHGKETPVPFKPLLLVDNATCDLLDAMSSFDFHVRLGRDAEGEILVQGVNGVFFTSPPAAPLRDAMLSAELAMSAEDARDAAEEDAVVDALSALSVADAAMGDGDDDDGDQQDAKELDPRLVEAMCAALQGKEEVEEA